MTNYRLEELSIELGNKCLMNCMQCSSGSSPKSFDNELTTEEVLRLLREARQLGATVVSFSGGDPILIYPEVLSGYIREALDLGYERVLLYTTGVHYISRKFHGLDYDTYAYNVLHEDFRDILTVIFSLESHEPRVHDYIMGVPGSWQAIVDNIKFVVDRGFNVEIHAVPMLPNWRDLWALRKLCMDMGCSKLSLLRFVPQTRGRANNRQLALNVREFEVLQRMIDNMMKHNDEGIVIRAGCPIDFRHMLQNGIDEKPHPCHAGKDLILVRPRGDVHPCAAWKSLPETDNIRDRSLADIWENSVVFKAIREYQEFGWQRIQGVCSSCKFQPSCKSGCPAQRMHALKMNSRADMQSSIDDLYVHAADPLCTLAHR